jgi:DNA-binding NarL/FixJ family response regulator
VASSRAHRNPRTCRSASARESLVGLRLNGYTECHLSWSATLGLQRHSLPRHAAPFRRNPRASGSRLPHSLPPRAARTPQQTPDPDGVLGEHLAFSARPAQAGGPLLPACPHTADKERTEMAEDVISPAEQRVLEKIAAGRTNQEAASELRLSRHTVDVHVKSILKKLGASTRAEAASKALGLGLLRGRKPKPAKLTEAEAEVLSLVATGLSEKRIGFLTNRTINTVQTLARRARGKLNARSNAEAIVIATRLGLLGNKK